MIEIKKLCLAFTKEYDALHDINIDIADGQKIALVGDKESGKTMILRALAKLEEPKCGEILIDGTQLKNVDFKKDYCIGFVPANFVFLKNKTVKQNLEYVLKMRNVDSATINLRVLSALKNYDILAIQNFKIKDLSPCQKTLVELARVSLRKIKLYLIDDITASLLPSDALQILQKIKMLMQDNAQSTFVCAFRKKTTIFFTSIFLQLHFFRLAKHQLNP